MTESQLIICDGNPTRSKRKCPSCGRFGEFRRYEYYAPRFDCNKCGFVWDAETGFWFEKNNWWRSRDWEKEKAFVAALRKKGRWKRGKGYRIWGNA